MREFGNGRLFGLLLSVAIATDVSAATVVNEGVLTRMYLYESHTGLLVKHSDLKDPENCGSGNYFILEKSHPHYADIYALMLAAYMAGRNVGMTISGCHQSYPAIRHVYVTP